MKSKKLLKRIQIKLIKKLDSETWLFEYENR